MVYRLKWLHMRSAICSPMVYFYMVYVGNYVDVGVDVDVDRNRSMPTD